MEGVDEVVFWMTYETATAHAAANTRCCHFGCALLIDNRLEYLTTNSKDYHAEIAALRYLDERESSNKDSIDLLIIRVLKIGTPAMAKPCVKCLPVIQQKDIRFVYYTDISGEVRKELAACMTSTHYCTSHWKEMARDRRL